MIYVEVTAPFAALVDTAALEQAARTVLRQQEVPPESDLSLILTDDEQLHHLNRQFRQVDAPTDVLSFPAHEIDPESGRLYLGDVIISVPRAQAQAQQGGHAVQDELLLLVVHGVLHLLGHDHAAAEEKDRMWAAQRAALQALGCPLDPP